jgi:hypothetical protein
VALLGQGLLVERLQHRVVLGQHAPHPGQRPFLGVGQVPNDLDDRPLPGRWSAAQPGVVGSLDQGAQHHRGRPQGLDDLYSTVKHRQPPRVWPSRGGQFTAMEEPELLAQDLREFFRGLR